MKAVLVSPSEIHLSLSRMNLERMVAQLDGKIKTQIPGTYRVGDGDKEPTIIVFALEDEHHYPPVGRMFSADRAEGEVHELFNEMHDVLLEIHSRHTVNIGDALWTKIDDLARKLRPSSSVE